MIGFRIGLGFGLATAAIGGMPGAGAAHAAPPPASPVTTPGVASQPSEPSVVPGWSVMVDGLRELPDRILARLPDAQRADPQVRQEAARLALSAVAAAAIDALAGDPDHPAFVPQLNVYLTTGQPNADTNYRSAKIAPGGTYRLRGRRGSMAQVRIAESGPRPAPVTNKVDLGAPRPVHDLNALRVDRQGRYDVILSPVRPAGYKGDWWPLDLTTNMLLVRMVGADWGREVEPSLSIERLDAPAPRPQAPAGVLEARLRAIPQAAGFIAPLLADRPAKMRADGVVNRLRAVDFSRMGGLAGQYYYEGAFDLAMDEALIVETPVPAGCGYRSMILTDDLYQTIDWYNNQSSLNGTQAPVDRDGVQRVVVSARDPGVANWLDTSGHATGVIQGRWLDCLSQPVPTVRKVAVGDVRRLLPSTTPIVTPVERDRQLRERRALLQQRPLW